MNPISLVIFALSNAWTWVFIGITVLGIVLAFVVFGGGWS